MIRRAAVRVALLLVAIAGCSPAGRTEEGGGEVRDTSSPSASPDLVGTVTAVQGASIRVEENPAEESGSAKAVVRLTSDTRIVRRSGEAASRSDIRVGGKVRVWFIGPVLESYPVQVAGRIVEIED